MTSLKKFMKILLVTVIIFLNILLLKTYILVTSQHNKHNISVYSPPDNKTVDSRTQGNSHKGTKYILFWTTALGSATWYFGSTGAELFKKCKVNNCYVTSNRTFRPIDTYDAVMFYSPTPKAHTDLPEKRSPHQRYVFSSGETPILFHGPRAQYVLPNFYNWTMTYRLDSDIIRRHGYVVERQTKYEMPTEEAVRNKTRSVAWFVSRCHSNSKREHIARELQKYIDVDIYGACGTLSCPRTANCHQMLGDKYKFYLSFENSHCKDYTTEKLFTVLRYNVVPVVYGGGDYEAVTPPHSVINVEDFKSVEDLAKYLKSLSEDIQWYLEYFKWKKNYFIELGNRRTVCQLCEKLNDPSEPKKVYENIEDWWFSKTMSQCKTGKELPNIVMQ